MYFAKLNEMTDGFILEQILGFRTQQLQAKHTQALEYPY